MFGHRKTRIPSVWLHCLGQNLCQTNTFEAPRARNLGFYESKPRKRPKSVPEAPRARRGGPRRPQNRPKSGPRAAKSAPRAAKSRPKRPRRAPRRAPGGPQTGSKRAAGRPRAAQGRQEAQKVIFWTPRRGQNGLLEASGGLLGARSAPGGRPGRSETAPGRLLGRSWRLLGPSWAALGASWGRLGAPGAVPGGSRGGSGRPFWCFFGGPAQEARKI